MQEESPDDPPTLKCVIARSDRRNLCDLVRDALVDLAGEAEVRALNEDAFLAYCPHEPATLRDHLRASLQEGESLFVLEFEKWSGFGPAADHEWLLQRGH